MERQYLEATATAIPIKKITGIIEQIDDNSIAVSDSIIFLFYKIFILKELLLRINPNSGI